LINLFDSTPTLPQTLSRRTGEQHSHNFSLGLSIFFFPSLLSIFFLSLLDELTYFFISTTLFLLIFPYSFSFLLPFPLPITSPPLFFPYSSSSFHPFLLLFTMSQSKQERNVWLRLSLVSVALTNGSESDFDPADGSRRMGEILDTVLDGSDKTQLADTTIKKSGKGKQPLEGCPTEMYEEHCPAP
jgi:hypothetical protein